MKCRPVNVMEGQGENPLSNSLHPQLKKQTLQLTTATIDQDIQLKQQTPQLATATLDKIQLKKQTFQLVTATVGQDIAEAEHTTAGNSNSWPIYS